MTADADWDEQRRVLTVTPLLIRSGPVVDFGGVRVVGKSGKTVQALLVADKTIGRPVLQGRDRPEDTQLAFDSNEPLAPKKRKAKKEGDKPSVPKV